jgi:hypothetical protein
MQLLSFVCRLPDLSHALLRGARRSMPGASHSPCPGAVDTTFAGIPVAAPGFSQPTPELRLGMGLDSFCTASFTVH